MLIIFFLSLLRTKRFIRWNFTFGFGQLNPKLKKKKWQITRNGQRKAVPSLVLSLLNFTELAHRLGMTDKRTAFLDFWWRSSYLSWERCKIDVLVKQMSQIGPFPMSTRRCALVFFHPQKCRTCIHQISLSHFVFCSKPFHFGRGFACLTSLFSKLSNVFNQPLALAFLYFLSWLERMMSRTARGLRDIQTPQIATRNCKISNRL